MTLLRPLGMLLFTAVLSSAAPGDLKWSHTTGGAVRSSPAAGTNGWIIFGSFDKFVYALSPDRGELKWKTTTEGPVISSPAIGENGVVHIGTTNGLSALDGQNGSRRWAFRNNPVIPIYSTPTLGADGTIYINTAGGTVCALVSTGALRWATNMYDGPFPISSSSSYSSPVLGRDGGVFLGASALGWWAPNASVRSIDSASGQVRWIIQTVNSIQATAAVGQDGTLFVCGFDKAIYAMDPATGAKKWERLTGDSISSSPALGPDGTLYVGANDGYLYAISSSTGAIKWRFLTGDSIHSSPAVAADSTVYFGSHDKNFYALDGRTGAKKWAFTTGGFVLSSPLIGPDGTVYVGSYDGKLYALEGTAPPAQGWSMFKGNPRHTGNAADTFPAPLLANPHLRTTDFAFDLLSTPGKSYRIEYSDDLAAPVWTELTNAAVTTFSLPLIDPSASTTPFRYYRARIN